MKLSFVRVAVKGFVDAEDYETLQCYVCILFDKSLIDEKDFKSVGMCRQYLFISKQRSIENCPPTCDALLLHSKRAVLQTR